MKKILFVFLMASFIGVKFLFSQQLIQSTPTGGAWNSGGTWVGGIIPGATDTVVINGTVTVSLNVNCSKLIISQGAVLTNSNTYVTINVTGDIINNGSILHTNTSPLDDFKVNLSGDLYNNGVWQSIYTQFTGLTVQNIYCQNNNYLFTEGPMTVTNAGLQLVAQTPLLLKSALNLNHATLNLQGYDLFLDGNGRLKRGTVTQVADVYFNNNGQLGGYQDTLLITGDTITLQNKAHFGTLTVQGVFIVTDTLRNGNNEGISTLDIIGSFINQGNIVHNYTSVYDNVTLKISGDIYNYGIWEPTYTKTRLTGSTTQHLYCAQDKYFFSDGNIVVDNPSVQIIAETPLYLKSPLILNYSTLNLQNNDLFMNSSGKIKNGSVNNVQNLYFPNNGKLGGAQDTLTLSGDTIKINNKGQMGKVTINGVLLINDSLTNHESLNWITVNGKVINNGVIYRTVISTGDSYNIIVYGDAINNNTWTPQHTEVTGNLTNNAGWTVSSMTFSGNAMRTIKGTGLYSSGNIYFKDTLNLIGNNVIQKLLKYPSYPTTVVVVHPNASLEITDKVAPAELVNYGKVFWKHDINCVSAANYDFYQGQIRNNAGCSVSQIVLETFSNSPAPGTTDAINRYWRMYNIPFSYNDTLQRIILTYADNVLNGNAQAGLKVFHSDNSGITWRQITQGVTIDTVNKKATILNAPPVGLYTLASQTTGVFSVRPSLTSLNNNTGGNSIMSFIVYGSGITPNCLPRLYNSDLLHTITPDTIQVSPTGDAVQLFFTLTTEPLGVYDVVVEIPGDTIMTLPDAFTIEQKQTPEPFVHLAGRDQIMPGRWQTYTIIYGNTANIDARATPLFLAISEVPGLEVEFVDFAVTMTDFSIQMGYDTLFLDTMSIYINTDTAFNDYNGVRLYPLYIPCIAAHSVQSIRFKIKTNYTFLQIQVAMMDPLYVNPFDAECVLGVLAEGILDISTSAIPGVGCAVAAGKNGFKTADGYLTTGIKDLGSWIYDWGVTVIDCVVNISGAGAFSKAAGVFFANMYGYYSGYDKCRPKPIRGKKITNVVSYDPNDKKGPAGYTDMNYISYPNELLYSVYFENLDSATAPAQTVSITDTLNLAVYDIHSFRFGPVQFDTLSIMPLVGDAKDFTEYYDMRPAKDIILKIEGHADTLTGIVIWDFTSLDPMTGELTEDPLGGFLNPNVNAPEGEGNVSFFINYKTGLANNTQLDNKATIVFDVNTPIATGTFSNRLDLMPPTVNMGNHTLENDSTVTLHWAGTDLESGIRDYTLHFSEDDTTYKAISFGNGESSTTFVGEMGKTYYFYITSTDSVGNTSTKPATPDLTLTFTPSSVNKPSVSDNNISAYPIPVENILTISISNSNLGNTEIQITDLKGKLILKSNCQNTICKLDMSAFDKGLYLIKVINREKTAVFKAAKL